MTELIRQVFDVKGAVILSAVFLSLFYLQSKWTLRKPTQPVFRRAITNMLMSIPSFTLLRFAFLPAMVFIAIQNREIRFGLNYLFDFAPIIEATIAFLIMDYTNYLWHIINHKVPLLWRFHIVHHSDPDLDITTALRFHFGELIGSVFFRGFFIFLSGASPLQVLLYEILFEAATQFHHSNWKLPFQIEKVLSYLIVTPRMHGIHHSIIKEETDSNYAVILSLWDRLHRTIRLNVSQDKIITGVSSYQNPNELTIPYLLKMPFTRLRSWKDEDKVREQNTLDSDKNSLQE